MGRPIAVNPIMRCLLPALLSFIVTVGFLSAGENEKKSPPNPTNPAKSDFPAYWDAGSWDTTESATTFWTGRTAKAPRKTPKPSSEEPVSPSSQPKAFLDRQSEK